MYTYIHMRKETKKKKKRKEDIFIYFHVTV